jgi:hypothetical protein
MHSFQPSRGRILFEVFCAFAVVASMVGAWRQTDASALLVAATVAGLYGFVRLFDMPGSKKAEAVEPQRIEFEPETADIVVPMMAPDPRPVVEEVEAVELAEARAGSGRRSGGSRKGGGRRAKAPKAAKAVEAMPVDEVETPWPMAAQPEAAEATDPTLEEEEFVFPHEEESSQPHIAPLFEPEPFARMPRRAFGRRGRL